MHRHEADGFTLKLYGISLAMSLNEDETLKLRRALMHHAGRSLVLVPSDPMWFPRLRKMLRKILALLQILVLKILRSRKSLSPQREKQLQ